MSLKYEQILDRLVKARVNAGLNQSQTSKMFVRSTMWLSDIERGNTPLPVSTLLELVELYDVSIEWVMTGVNPYFDPQTVMDHATRLGDDANSLLELFSMLDNNKVAK